jgi:hypothetical protein
MIRIFFKTIWNNRRRNILVFIELFVISLFLFNLTFYLVDIISIIRIKNCYDAHNVIFISLSKKGSEEKVITEQSFNNLKMKLASNEFVESVSFCANATPFNYIMARLGFKYGNEEILIVERDVDIDYEKVMKITPLKGRWFNETDIGKSVKPVLISNDLEKKYFNGNAIGKRFGADTNMFEIIGIVDHFKRSDIEKPYSFGFFFEVMPTWEYTILIRSKEGYIKDLLFIT